MDRRKTYEWFKTFKNPTYGVNVNLDVTKLVKYTKETNSSFFINFLFILVKCLNKVPEMRERIVNGEPVLYDVCNPGITVLTKNDTFENVRFSYVDNYHEFYNIAKENIDKAISLIKKSVSELVKGKFTEEDVNNAKNNIINNIELNSNSQSGINNNYVSQKFVNDYTFEEKKEHIKNVTKSDIITFAKKLKLNVVYALCEDQNGKN